MSNLVTLAVPGEYKYVLLTATLSTFITSYHTHLTGEYRAAAKVTFPNAYATAVEAATSPEKYRFNCAQKAHANFTENHTSFVTVLLIAGLKYPKISTALGATWVLARVLYVLGYTRKYDAEDGKGRHWGSWWALPHMALMGFAVASSLQSL